MKRYIFSPGFWNKSRENDLIPGDLVELKYYHNGKWAKVKRINDDEIFNVEIRFLIEEGSAWATP